MAQKGNTSLVGDLGNNPAIQAALAGIIAQLLAAVPGLLIGLFNRKPTTPITSPTPAPVPQDDDFPDDTIPEPSDKREVKRAVLKLARAQYNKQRFPDQYKDGNNGLYSDEDKRSIQEGDSALNYASKFWLDITAYDDDDKEFLRPAVLTHGLAYKTEFHVGDAYILGFGPDEKNVDGSPRAEVVHTNEMGHGITAWNNSFGFLHQMKARKEGEYDVYAVVDGVETNHFTLKVS